MESKSKFSSPCLSARSAKPPTAVRVGGEEGGDEGGKEKGEREVRGKRREESRGEEGEGYDGGRKAG